MRGNNVRALPTRNTLQHRRGFASCQPASVGYTPYLARKYFLVRNPYRIVKTQRMLKPTTNRVRSHIVLQTPSDRLLSGKPCAFAVSVIHVRNLPLSGCRYPVWGAQSMLRALDDNLRAPFKPPRKLGKMQASSSNPGTYGMHTMGMRTPNHSFLASHGGNSLRHTVARTCFIPQCGLLTATRGAVYTDGLNHVVGSQTNGFATRPSTTVCH